MKREKWWKIFHLPSPKELGWTDSEYNALPMRMFSQNNGNEHTWEDWEEKVREEYPFRYFMSETLPSWFRYRIQRPIKDAWYWIICHLLPSRRYHILDLRQPENKERGLSGYKYGWIDSDTKMLYALFNILNKFVEDEVSNWYCPSEEEVQSEPHLLYQRNNWLETKAIHYWWNVERIRQMKEHDDLLGQWSDAQKANAPETHQLWDELKKADKAQEDKEDEMIARLLKIRRSLWT
jgi:hypothetical protein